MLLIAYGNCEKCSTSFLGDMEQDVKVQCEKCRKNYRLCSSCKEENCPRCGSRLLDCREKMAQRGLNIKY